MSISRGGASQLLNASPAKRFNESILQNQREQLPLQIVSGVYDPSNVVDDHRTMLSKTRTEVLPSDIRVRRPWGYRMSFPVPIFRRLLPIGSSQAQLLWYALFDYRQL